MNLLRIALIIFIISMLLSMVSSETFADFKTMVNEGLVTNQKVDKKLSNLKENFCQNVNNLKGGILAWSNEIDQSILIL